MKIERVEKFPGRECRSIYSEAIAIIVDGGVVRVDGRGKPEAVRAALYVAAKRIGIKIETTISAGGVFAQLLGGGE